MNYYTPQSVLDTRSAYTGIGSRKTPPDVLVKQRQVATAMEQRGFWLWSGGAPGADQAFESGASARTSFLPWDGFEGKRQVYSILPQAYEIAAKFHPMWKTLSFPVRSLMARNAHQVLGPTLEHKSNVVICWTPDGCEDYHHRSRETGGTGLAISLASSIGVPIVNMCNDFWSEKLSEITDYDFTFIERTQ